MKERELARFLCVTCTGTWPRMASLVETSSGLRFRSKFKSKAIQTTHTLDGDGVQLSSTRGRLRVRQESLDLPFPGAQASYRCGCPNGCGVVAFDESDLADIVETYRREGERQEVHVEIAPLSTRYEMHPIERLAE